jgi:hypothetical protein
MERTWSRGKEASRPEGSRKGVRFKNKKMKIQRKRWAQQTVEFTSRHWIMF